MSWQVMYLVEGVNMRVIYFKSPTCAPCMRMTPIVKDFGKAEVIDSSKEESLAMIKEYDIKAVPTTIVVDSEGVEIKRKVGYMNETAFKEFVS